ncbi:MAG: 3'-5' exonuclease [Cruoricaptor ignavus]|nr:3'-5' exonuclease [Cruoricaptor ignavus]
MYSIIDIESNGGAFRKESIIEIAIYKYDGHSIVDQFISLVNPEADITNFVQKLTGITQKMVRTAPKFHEIARRVVEITEGTTLVGHNIDFDYRMLRQSFSRLGYEFKINVLDTIPLAKKLIPEAESYSLSKLVKSLGIPLTEAHRAGGDARATLDLFKLLINKDIDNDIIQKHHEETNAKTYVNKIKELTQDLPNEQGIVYFQNADGQILFTDFVDDINRFSKRLFNSKSKRYKNIQEQSSQIHYELAGSTILAKLMMKTKGVKKRETLPFGLYFRNGKYLVEKNSANEKDIPVLKFRSFTQGLKALEYIKSQTDLADISQLLELINLKNKNGIWSINGRTLGEKAFMIMEKGKVLSYGFYELHTQIQNQKTIDGLKIDIKGFTEGLKNDLKLALLKNDVEIFPLPKK